MAPSQTAAARVVVVGKDPIVTSTLARLLELDSDIQVVSQAGSVGTARIADARPDVVIVDEGGEAGATADARLYVEKTAPDAKLCGLEVLVDLTLRQLLAAVKDLAETASQDRRARHLHVIGTPEQDALATLSDRELEVVRLVAEGLSNKEISGRLSLSDKTVKNHISHILAKMNLSARTQVAVYALRAGLA